MMIELKRTILSPISEDFENALIEFTKNNIEWLINNEYFGFAIDFKVKVPSTGRTVEVDPHAFKSLLITEPDGAQWSTGSLYKNQKWVVNGKEFDNIDFIIYTLFENGGCNEGDN